MSLTRTVLLLVSAGLLASAHGKSEPVRRVASPPVFQQLPDVMDAVSRDLLEHENFEAAKARCEAQIDSTALVSEPGILAGPYLCLGEAQFGLKNYEGSVLAFSSAIDELERSAGVFDPRLVQPFEGLGKSLMRLGKLDAAEEALVQAKDLTHRNFGIYNLVQSSIVNRLTKTYYNKGDLTDASREQRFLLRAHEETYGESPQLLPAIRRMAKWHERTGRHDLARANYRRALQIMERAYGSDDLRLVGPLRDFARSYLNTPRGGNRVMSRAGANALMEVIKLYERQEFTDAVDLARSWSDLGDWYVIGGRRGSARKAYSEAGSVLDTAGEQAGDSIDLFSHPVEIEYEDIPIGLRPSRLRAIPEGIAILEFEFTVNAEGRVTNLTVVRDDLDYARFALEVGQRVKASRYRPRIVNGEPVATKGVRKVLRYDLTRRLPKEAPQTAGSEGEEAAAQSDGEGPNVDSEEAARDNDAGSGDAGEPSQVTEDDADDAGNPGTERL